MPLPGGSSDKVGNRYEARWTVDRMIAVLTGKSESIRLEPPASIDHGFEFFLRRGSVLAYHQVKRQQAGNGHWTLADLAAVLENFRSKLATEGTECVFVSTQDALELRELGERARAAQSCAEFKATFLAPELCTPTAVG